MMRLGMFEMKPCEVCGGDRPHNNKGQCMACRQRVKRQATGLRRAKLPRPVRNVARTSRKAVAAAVLPLAQEIIRRRAKGHCERCGILTPSSHGEHSHRLPRKAGGTARVEVNSAANLLWLCKPCHRHIEKYRIEAYEHGWLLFASATPTKVGVLMHAHGWSLLVDDGTITACDPPEGVTA